MENGFGLKIKGMGDYSRIVQFLGHRGERHKNATVVSKITLGLSKELGSDLLTSVFPTTEYGISCVRVVWLVENN